MENLQTSDHLLSVSEAAKLIGICENTLRQWDINGKFEAIRTEGGHRRYTLTQIREYLEKQPIEANVEKETDEQIPLNKITTNKAALELISKYQKNGWLDNVEDAEKPRLAILLNNVEMSYDAMTNVFSEGNQIFSLDELLWLNKEAWMRCRFRKMVSIQPMTHPASLIHYLDRNIKAKEGMIIVQSEAVAAKTQKYNFSIFKEAEFDSIKNVYANAIAAELDEYIFKKLASVEHCIDALNNADIYFTEKIDWIIAPKDEVAILSEKSHMERVDLFGIDTILEEKTLRPLRAIGKYNQSYLEKPIFCPYILFQESPALCNQKTSFAFLRTGWLE